jgi:hypothetical protein
MISAIRYIDQKIKKNTSETNKSLAAMIHNAEELIDIQCKIASYFVGWWSYKPLYRLKGLQKLSPLLFSAFHKNIFSFYSALRLSSYGLYGPARPLLRNIFEWLMISKFSSISENASVLANWNDEKTIYFSNSVLKKIKIPDPIPFYLFWSLICDFSHATRTSMQISLDIKDKDNNKDIMSNIAIINALIECNYHLLNTHLITSEYAYMGKYYFNRERFPQSMEYKVPNLRKQAHIIFKRNRNFLGSESLNLIGAYKRKWKLSV